MFEFVWREFPGGPVVRTQCFHCWSQGSVPGPGTKIPQAVWHGQKKGKSKNNESLKSIDNGKQCPIPGNTNDKKVSFLKILEISTTCV